MGFPKAGSARLLPSGGPAARVYDRKHDDLVRQRVVVDAVREGRKDDAPDFRLLFLVGERVLDDVPERAGQSRKEALFERLGVGAIPGARFAYVAIGSRLENELHSSGLRRLAS